MRREIILKEGFDQERTYRFVGKFNSIPDVMDMRVRRMTYCVSYFVYNINFFEKFRGGFGKRDVNREFKYSRDVYMEPNFCKVTESISEEEFVYDALKFEKCFVLPLEENEERTDRLTYLEHFISYEDEFIMGSF